METKQLKDRTRYFSKQRTALKSQGRKMSVIVHSLSLAYGCSERNKEQKTIQWKITSTHSSWSFFCSLLYIYLFVFFVRSLIYRGFVSVCKFIYSSFFVLFLSCLEQIAIYFSILYSIQFKLHWQVVARVCVCTIFYLSRAFYGPK